MRHYTGEIPTLNILGFRPAETPRLIGSGSIVPQVEPESAEDRNARENAAKQAAGEGPTIIVGPDSAPTFEDARAIVQHVALRVLLNELDYHGLNELTGNYHAELAGLSEDTIRRAIREGLE